MPRTRKPEAAAKAIIDMIAKHEATDAADAVKKKPELEPGLKFFDAAVATDGPSPSTPSPAAAPAKKARTRTKGSGPLLISR